MERYLRWGLTNAIREMRDSDATRGSTMRHINRGPFLAHPLPLPPLAEQQRIVEAIEEQFSRLDAGVASLRRAQRNLRRMRESVLTAAVEGRLLTHDNPSTWEQVSLSEVASVASGQTPKGIEAVESETIPYFKVGDMNLAEGRWMSQSRAYLDEAAVERLRMRVHPAGTVVFPKRGGAIATNKKRVPRNPACLDLNTIGVAPGSRVLASYLCAGSRRWTSRRSPTDRTCLR